VLLRVQGRGWRDVHGQGIPALCTAGAMHWRRSAPVVAVQAAQGLRITLIALLSAMQCKVLDTSKRGLTAGRLRVDVQDGRVRRRRDYQQQRRLQGASPSSDAGARSDSAGLAPGVLTAKHSSPRTFFCLFLVCFSDLVFGVLRQIENCDDGNAEDGDGCSSVCQVEVGFQCVGSSNRPALPSRSAVPGAVTRM
jgi:cysteine-rich repeat protein